MKEKYYITEIAFNRAINVTHSFFFLFISYLEHFSNNTQHYIQLQNSMQNSKESKQFIIGGYMCR